MAHVKTIAGLMALLVTGGLAFSVSCLIASLPDTATTAAAESGSYTARLFGQSRLAFSSDSYQMADLYFHKGVGDVTKTAITNGFFIECAAELSPKRVEHLEGTHSKDIIPWIWLAVRSDPQNILPYRVGAFFLSSEVGRLDLAHKLLQEGRANNPFSYEIAMEDAILYLKEKNIEEALKYFNAADAFWPSRKPEADPDTLNDLSQILFFRSLVNEDAGKIDEAVVDLQKLVVLFPDRPGYKQHLELLEAGNQPSMLAKPLLHDMLRAQDRLERIDTKHGETHETHSEH